MPALEEHRDWPYVVLALFALAGLLALYPTLLFFSLLAWPLVLLGLSHLVLAAGGIVFVRRLQRELREAAERDMARFARGTGA